MGFSGDASGKEPACQCRKQMQVRSLGWENPLEEGMALTPKNPRGCSWLMTVTRHLRMTSSIDPEGTPVYLSLLEASYPEEPCFALKGLDMSASYLSLLSKPPFSSLD